MIAHAVEVAVAQARIIDEAVNAQNIIVMPLLSV